MMIELLNEELQRTMSFVGFPTIADVDAAPLRRLVETTTASTELAAALL
jgi:hypothetical protein